jgi:AcrR family transcriptional regulator
MAKASIGLSGQVDDASGSTLAQPDAPSSWRGSIAGVELPLSQPAAPERADAARNRARILEAAARLLSEQDGRELTMEQIAHAAGVGKATLYRRYPDVPSIAVALLDEHERELQDRLLRGEPPLGPGAPPGERLAAFYRAMVELLERQGHLALAAETGERRYRTGAYGAWATHVRGLLAEAGLADHPALVDALLAPLAPDVHLHQRRSGLTAEQISEDLAALARRALSP